jgi:hypothetical protein
MKKYGSKQKSLLPYFGLVLLSGRIRAANSWDWARLLEIQAK